MLGVSLWPFAHQLLVWLSQWEVIEFDPRTLAAAKQLIGKIQEVPPALLITTLGIVPAVCEEFFFRGYLLSSLRNSMSATRAVLLSSVLVRTVPSRRHRPPALRAAGPEHGLGARSRLALRPLRQRPARHAAARDTQLALARGRPLPESNSPTGAGASRNRTTCSRPDCRQAGSSRRRSARRLVPRWCGSALVTWRSKRRASQKHHRAYARRNARRVATRPNRPIGSTPRRAASVSWRVVLASGVEGLGTVNLRQNPIRRCH